MSTNKLAKTYRRMLRAALIRNHACKGRSHFTLDFFTDGSKFFKGPFEAFNKVNHACC